MSSNAVWFKLSPNYIKYFLDCSSVGAELDVFKETDRCIAVDTPSSMVNNDTLVLDACSKLFGANAKLISLPSNETDLWNYLLTHLDAYVL